MTCFAVLFCTSKWTLNMYFVSQGWCQTTANKYLVVWSLLQIKDGCVHSPSCMLRPVWLWVSIPGSISSTFTSTTSGSSSFCVYNKDREYQTHSTEATSVQEHKEHTYQKKHHKILGPEWRLIQSRTDILLLQTYQQWHIRHVGLHSDVIILFITHLITRFIHC